MDPRDRYCLQICHAKCCVLFEPGEGAVPCPNLKSDHSCRIYAKRYAPGAPDLVQVGRYRSKLYVNRATGKPAFRPFMCGRITDLLADGRVPAHIRDGCVLSRSVFAGATEMKATVTLEPADKMTERDTREAIQKAARHARDMADQKGRPLTQEQARKVMESHANKSLRERQEKGE